MVYTSCISLFVLRGWVRIHGIDVRETHFLLGLVDIVRTNRSCSSVWVSRGLELTRHGGETMIRSPWKRFVHDCGTPGGQRSRGRRQVKLGVECEALDSRQLLSTVVAAGTAFS